MRKALGRIKRTVSVLLAAAMILTALPQAGVTVYASEVQSVPDESGGTDRALDPAEQDTAGENDSGGTASADEISQDGADSGNRGDPEEKEDEGSAAKPETGEGTEAGQPGTGDKTDVDQPQDGNETDVDEPQEDDGMGTEEQEPGIDADETLPDDVEKVDQEEITAVTTDETPGEGEEVKKISVDIALPYYKENSRWTPCLTEFSYAVGEGEDVEFQPVTLEEQGVSSDGKGTYRMQVEAGKNLRFKLACKDIVRLKEVSWTAQYGSGYYDHTDPKVIEAKDGEYTFTVNDLLSQGYVRYYKVDIKALQTWNITFVDLYAEAHDNTPSVEVYQKKQNNEGETEEPVNIAGQTITVDSEEWVDGYNGQWPVYTVKPKEGFTFDSIATTATGITIQNRETGAGTKEYWLTRNGYEPGDITIFVTAQQSQQKTITLNMPADGADSMQAEVYGKGPSDADYNKLEKTGNTVTVKDDMNIRVSVTSADKTHMVQATYQEEGGEAEPFSQSDVYTSMSGDGWTRRYTLGALSQFTGGVTVNLSRVGTRKVEMAVDWTTVSGISVSTPYSEYFQKYEDISDKVVVYVPEKETLKFYVEMQNGKGAAVVSTEAGDKIEVAGYDYHDSNNQHPYYSMVPTADMNLSVQGREYVYRFDYSEDDASILVYEADRNSGPGGDPLELTDHCYRSNKRDSYLWIMVKPKAGKEISVWYENSSGDRQDVSHEDIYDKTYEDDGKYFCYGPIDEFFASDRTITIKGYNANTVTFQTEEEGLYFREMSYNPDGDYFDEENVMEDNSVTVREGETLYFRVRGYNSNTNRLLISMKGTDRDSLKSRWNDENMEDYLVYYFVPAADTTLTFALEERKQCEVVVEKSDAVKSFYAEYESNGYVNEFTTAGTYQIREDGYLSVRDILAAGSDAEAAAKKGKVTCQIGEETYEVSPEYNLDEGGLSYNIKVTDSMKVRIDVQDITQYTLSVKEFAQLENICVWEWGTYKDKNNLYRGDGTVTLDDSEYYYMDFQPKDGSGVGSVKLKDGAGVEKILARTYLEEDGDTGYRIGMLRGNTEITPELVPGYTVKFDLSKLSAEDKAAVKIYDASLEDELIVGQKDNQDIGSRKLSAAVSESSSFDLRDWKRYRLTLDSELFTLSRVYQSEENGTEGYVCVLSPKQTTGLPGVVTVSLEKYAEHTVTLDYPGTIRSIRLKDTYGASFKTAENQPKTYKVYGEGAVLSARAIDGYSPVVKIKGSAEGAEATKLEPYRTDGAGTFEYYIGELTEDKTIEVTVERSTQRKTYYKVGFLSEGGHVVVRDSAYHTVYDINSDEESYGADYSVLKGNKISFYVAPDLGYELRGVYANGQRVQPVSDAASSRDIYEVTPVSETKIRIDVAKIVPRYPLTFSWTNTDAVKGVTVQGYELQDNRIDVAEGEKISFQVELTDTKYSVTSVKMNGQEVPYSAGSGLYTLTALNVPMNVEITAGVADKVIRFINTLENAKYEVETDELIRHRNEDTYLASGNAELMKFKVNVPDQTMEVGVTYINQQGVKSVLKEKAKTDLGEQGLSYSYEIAVAELPLNSEITIGGAIPAGDKKELEKAVGEYEAYRKSDYTEETWPAFEQALKDAQECMKKESATQEEIDAALGRLQSAAAALVKKGDTPADPDDPDDPGPNAPEGLWIKAIPDVTYSGTAFKPAVKVYHGRKLLTEKKDYTVAYKNNVKAGKAEVTVTGKGNYKAKDTAEFNILKKNINDEDIVIDDVCAVIKPNGTVANPKVAVKSGKKALKANSDYKVTYPEFEKSADGKIVPKTYRIIISTTQVKKKGSAYVDAENFTGTREIDYTVCPEGTLLMSSAKITLDTTKVDYAGVLGADTVKPQVTAVKIGGTTLEKTDYTVDYENWDQAGKATVTVTATGTKYFGSKSVTYTVNGTKLTAGQLVITGLDDKTYTGQPVYVSDDPVTGAKGTMAVKTKDGKTLVEGVDYTVSYKTGKVEGAHTNAGTVNVTLTGINAYSGTVKKSFKITPFDLADYSKAGAALTFEVEGDGKAKYTKNGAKPAFTLRFDDGESRRKLAEKADFTISYTGNTKIRSGEKSAAMTIKGKGNFKGTISYQYEVTAASESDVYAVAEDIAVPDQFKKLKTTVKVLERETGKALKAGTDYDKDVMYYTDAACTASVTADNFSGLNLGVDSRVYAKVSLKAGGCYAGTVPGEKVAVFRLYDNEKKISAGSKFTVEVKTGETADGTKISCDQKGNPIYTGRPIEPKVVVTPKGGGTPLTEGTDYEVTYSNNVNKGKAAITVTAVGGGYGGSKSVKFTIAPSDMSWAEKAAGKAGAVGQKAVEIFSEVLMQN